MGVLGFAATMSILLYLDRYALSVAQPVMRDELLLDDQQMGHAQSAFFYIYALAQVPAGWVSQRFGARLTLALYVAVWSVALGGMGCITGLWSLVVFRGLLGLAQAGAYPCAGGLLRDWFPLQSRGFANSVTTTGGRTGYLLATILTPYLMVLVGQLLGQTTGQWRGVFAFYASLGMVWALVFWWWFRDSPLEHPGCNDAECRLIRGDTVAVDPAPRHSDVPPLLAMIKHPTVILLSLVGVFVNVGWIFLVTFLPTYLTNIHHLDLRLIGWLAALPGLAGMVGGVLGGMATDRLVRRVGLTWGRRIPGIIANGGAALAYALSLSTDNVIIQVALFASAGFLVDFGLGSLWAVYQDIGGKHVATVLGFANMCGNLSAGYFASTIGGYAKREDWSTVFLLAAGALLVTMTCWCFVRPTLPLLPPVPDDVAKDA